jgi:hypothetical protein
MGGLDGWSITTWPWHCGMVRCWSPAILMYRRHHAFRSISWAGGPVGRALVAGHRLGGADAGQSSVLSSFHSVVDVCIDTVNRSSVLIAWFY